ncbi:hypothetical protein AB0O07_19400 [Streptomyces sp. NPDC093085]|uniref:hypothetical protein n=1 Tax=Streptomyces sp. NPDC093085 TaxID=3155068 RepID=UPI0034149DC8
MPGRRAAEGTQDSEVQPAVPGAERADQRTARDAAPHVTGSGRSGRRELLPPGRWHQAKRERELGVWTG